jgi:4-hydroxy-tetrahydrodipicolinate reductase
VTVAQEVATVRVVCVGAGAIGVPIVEALLDNERFSVVGVVDPALSEPELHGVPVHRTLADCPDDDIGVAVLATGSQVSQIAEQVQALVARGFDVVSTSEELTFPWLRQPDEAAAIDHAAREQQRTVIGTGVNPGFLMDLLPVILNGAMLRPTRMVVTRRADLTRRRPKLSNKIGVGMTLDEWHAHGGSERLGHVGLLESAYLCALGLGGEPESASFERDPICDGTTVIGVHEIAAVRLTGGREVRLELVFSTSSIDEDVVEIDGDPGVRMVLDGGLHGDDATVARVVHTAARIAAMPAGLRLPLEIPAWAPDGVDLARWASS